MAELIPTESEEQTMFVQWFRLQYPHIVLMSIPNGSHKSKASAVKFQREGLLAGAPDLFIAHPTAVSHGLFIEMKRAKRGVVTAAQEDVIARLQKAGYSVCVCFGASQAIDCVKGYLDGYDYR